jgi:hypothetical protein
MYVPIGGIVELLVRCFWLDIRHVWCKIEAAGKSRLVAFLFPSAN